jgi:DNA modification methylase
MKLYLGNCLDVLKTLPDNSVDSVVTDPPYGLSFMGKKWDYDVPSVEVWAECLRVLKPGGHLLAFAGTRTQHRMAVRIEDAGFEIRDMIAWVYGSGFPKSLDVSKAIDKAAGAEREVIGSKVTGNAKQSTSATGEFADGKHGGQQVVDVTAPSTEAAQQWQGWGTALKPALEPITVARKPLIGTVAQNVLEHGTGALNIDGCRVGDGEDRASGGMSGGPARNGIYHDKGRCEQATGGRWPANLIHDGSDEVLAGFPVTKNGGSFGEQAEYPINHTVMVGSGLKSRPPFKVDSGGSAARFFYCAKASKRDRDEGLEGFEAKPNNSAYGDGLNTATKIRTAEQAEGGVSRELRRNTHPTVKPTDLMRYLCRLITPPNGVVLDPFMGSGSTGKAAVLEGFQFIGIEREAEYLEIARARIEHAQKHPRQETLGLDEVE